MKKSTIRKPLSILLAVAIIWTGVLTPAAIQRVTAAEKHDLITTEIMPNNKELMITNFLKYITIAVNLSTLQITNFFIITVMDPVPVFSFQSQNKPSTRAKPSYSGTTKAGKLYLIFSLIMERILMQSP